MRGILGVTFAGLMLVLTAASPVRAVDPIDGTGSVGNCPTRGIIKIIPGLVNGGTLPDVIKVKTKPPKGFIGPCPGASGDGANVVAGKGKGEGTGTANDCGNLLGPQPSNIVLTVKWKVAKGTPKLNPSTVSITTQTGGISSSPPSHGQFDVSGTVTAGSFLGDTVTASLITDQDLVEIAAACAAKGLKKITFGIKPSKDDLQIGSGSVSIN
jgi:hypothetical protein